MNNTKILEEYLKHKIKFKMNTKIFSSIESLKSNSIFFSQSIDEDLLRKINNLKNGILILPKKITKLKIK